eukprot:TRINITY_DN1637_c1_g3_i1.p1 TRINITY_DN1637_c1_g3~~TRINITY_DN1637_c1_g3_i1.p1  ORF type:complete len:384 (+),score=45.89 TRINITY_DN1637_c1_g3_i1:89-1153(+)
MSQGDLLNEKKRSRSTNKADSLPAIKQPPSDHTPPPKQEEPDEQQKNHDLLEYSLPRQQPSRVVQAQLNLLREPLQVPQPHDDFPISENSVGAYFAQPATREKQNLTAPQMRERELTPSQILSTKDYYLRPDLDEVSQRVVLESIVKQQQEQDDKKCEIQKRREITMAKFEAMKRSRLLLQIQSSIPVDPRTVDSYGLHGAVRTKNRRNKTATLRVQNNTKREELLRVKQILSPGIELHRNTMQLTMQKRMSRRIMTETDLGTCYKRSLAREPNTINKLIREQAVEHHKAAERDLEEESLERLASFASHQHVALKARKPRQRDIPYTLHAPYRHTSAHRPPIILSDHEKQALPS